MGMGLTSFTYSKHGWTTISVDDVLSNTSAVFLPIHYSIIVQSESARRIMRIVADEQEIQSQEKKTAILWHTNYSIFTFNSCQPLQRLYGYMAVKIVQYGALPKGFLLGSLYGHVDMYDIILMDTNCVACHFINTGGPPIDAAWIIASEVCHTIPGCPFCHDTENVDRFHICANNTPCHGKSNHWITTAIV